MTLTTVNWPKGFENCAVHADIRRGEPKFRREEALRSLFAAQHGVIHRSQAVELGYSPGDIARRLASKEWLVVHKSVYRFGAVAPSLRQSIKAACLALGEGAVASHRSAGYLLALDGIDRPTVEVSSVSTGRSSLPGVIIHRVGSLPACDVTVVQSIPTTNVSRTIVDAGAVLDEESVELLLEDGLRRGLTSIPRLEWRMRELCARGRSGCAVLRKILRERGVGPATASGLEVKLSRLLRRSGLPRPARQYEIHDGSRFVARPDFAYPKEKIAVEADGYRWHTGRAAWERELERRNEMQRLGWLIIHVTKNDLSARPRTIIAGIHAALKRRGHPELAAQKPVPSKFGL